MMSNAVEILLVEDTPSDAELTMLAFSRGHLANKLQVANDGIEALDYMFCRGKFSDRKFDDVPKLILLDLKLPKISGLEVLKQLKTDPRTRATPIVVLTSSNQQRDIADCYALGVNSYIIKPVNFQKFADAVRQLGMYWLLLNELPPQPAGYVPPQTV
jgi:two-component system, response regulator